MKKVSKVFILISIVSAILILIAFSIFMKNTNKFFADYYSQQLNDYSSIFRKTVEITKNYTEIYEQAVADDLYQRLCEINKEMLDIPLNKINTEQLNKFKEKYELSDMAIFDKNDDGIFVYNSTIPEEVGEKTEDWGYWNDAFERLFNRECPINKEGHCYKDYWIGPRSKSHYAPGYYRYAYYYNVQQDYLINAIIQDDNVYGENIINMLDDFFDHLGKEISYIEAVSLLDLTAWEKSYNNNFKNLEAPIFLYGDFDGDILVESELTPEDLYSIEHNKSLSLKHEGNDKTLFMISADGKDNPYLMIILIDDQQAKDFIQNTLLAYVALLIFTLAILVIGIYCIVIRYKGLLTFQVERNEEVERFTKDIAMLPEIAYKCKVHEGELMLTYNYGRTMHEEHKISLESIYRPMKEIYSEEYVEAFKIHIEPVFRGEARRFEIPYENGLYEHFTSPILGEDGNVKEIIGIANNITDRKLREDEAKYYASHDHLTGLTNRRAFEDEVEKQMTEDPDGLYAMMVIDIDDFKSVNDSFGHLSGDIVLKEVADRISNAIAEKAVTATIARMGGDEFCAYVPYTERQDIIDIAKDIIAQISKPYILPNASTNLSVSIGVSLFNLDSSTYAQLLHYADIAMYQAKKDEGGSYKFFSKSMCI